MTPTFTLSLPICPSVNAIYANARKGRVKSTKYRQWLDEAGWAYHATHPKPKPVDGSYSLQIMVHENMRGDLDNRIKAAQDFLVTYQLIEDDRLARSVSITRCASVSKDEMVLNVCGVSL